MNLDTIDSNIDCRQWCSLAMEIEVRDDGIAGPSLAWILQTPNKLLIICALA